MYHRDQPTRSPINKDAQWDSTLWRHSDRYELYLCNIAVEEEGKEKSDEERALLSVLHELADPKEDNGQVRKMWGRRLWAPGRRPPSAAQRALSLPVRLHHFHCIWLSRWLLMSGLSSGNSCFLILQGIDPLKVLHTIFQCNSIGSITTEELFSPMLYREKLRPRGEAVVYLGSISGSVTLAFLECKGSHLSTTAPINRDKT